MVTSKQEAIILETIDLQNKDNEYMSDKEWLQYMIDDLSKWSWFCRGEVVDEVLRLIEQRITSQLKSKDDIRKVKLTNKNGTIVLDLIELGDDWTWDVLPGVADLSE